MLSLSQHPGLFLIYKEVSTCSGFVKKMLPPTSSRLLRESGTLRSQEQIVEGILPSCPALKPPFMSPIKVFLLFVGQPWKLIAKALLISFLTQKA